jgi:transposase
MASNVKESKMSLHHTDDFKRYVVGLKQSGVKESELKRKYNLGNSTISRWEQGYKTEEILRQSLSSNPPEPASTEARLCDLQSRYDKMNAELDILKAAVSILCKKKG